MQYVTQAIICLASDLEESARVIHAKRIIAGDGKDEEGAPRSKLHLVGPPQSLDPEYCQPESRLIIVGHGNKQSQGVFGEPGSGVTPLTPQALASKVEMWLGARHIKHISLKVCYGAGFRNEQNPGRPNDWVTKYVGSLAHEFAKRCGYADTIGAYTDTHITVWKTKFSEAHNKDIVDKDFMPYSVVGRGDRYKTKGDKLMFYPDPAARPASPKPCRQGPTFKDAPKGKPWTRA